MVRRWVARQASLRERCLDKDLMECGNELCGKGVVGRGNSKCNGDMRVPGTRGAEH